MKKFIAPFIETFVVVAALVLISVIALKYYAPDTLYAKLDLTLRDLNKRIDSMVFASTVDTSNPALKKGEIPSVIASNIAIFKFRDIKSSPQPGYIDRMKFADFIRKLKELGYETISYSDYARASENREKLPANAIVLIFSSKTKETYDIVEPILNGVGYKATITYQGEPKVNLERSVLVPKTYVDDLLATGNWEYIPDAIPNIAFYSTNSPNDIISKINSAVNTNVTLAQNLDTINLGNNGILAQVLGESVSVNSENDLAEQEILDNQGESSEANEQVQPEPVLNTEPEPEQVTPEPLTQRIHTVRAGDNLWRISNIYYGSGSRTLDIANRNNIRSPFIIFPGQQLILP